MRIIIATHNQGKVKEIQAALQALPIEIVSLDEIDPGFEIPEPHSTYQENAAAKARAVSDISLTWALADDSGLEVDALNGEPGVYSARFGGEALTMPERCALILEKLKGVPREKRTARFRAILVLSHPEEGDQVFEGVWEGIIAEEAKGEKGFGYDPIFIDSATGHRASEMERDQKNALSHRGQALSKLMEYLRQKIS